jgi:hypothetical protein
MTHIVQQSRHYQRGRRIVPLGEEGRLQRMFQLRDCFAAVLRMAVLSKKPQDL